MSSIEGEPGRQRRSIGKGRRVGQAAVDVIEGAGRNLEGPACLFQDR